MHAEMLKIVEQVKAKYRAKQAERIVKAPDPRPFDIDAARAELASIRLDSNYEMSDDFTAYCRGRADAQRRAYLKQCIEDAEAMKGQP